MNKEEEKEKKEEKKDKIEELEFLSKKSNELLNKQITSYRLKQTNSGIIITVLAMFIPFFISGFDNSFLVIKICAILPIILILHAIVFLLKVLSGKPLNQGFDVNMLEGLVNKSQREILIYEIGANKSSFIGNKCVYDNIIKLFNNAIKFTVIAIIISSILLIVNTFYKPEQKPINIEILNNRK